MLKMLLSVVALVFTSPAALANHVTNPTDAFKEAHDNMMQGMSQPMSGDPDKDFVMMMIPHHQGAIDMAEVELKYGKDEKLRAMAKMIVEAQQQEIKEMKNWEASH